MPQMISVRFANTVTATPLRTVEVAEGTTIQALLDIYGGVPANSQIDLNRELVSDLEEELSEGDFLTVSPSNIKGA